LLIIDHMTLIQQLIAEGTLKTPRIIAAFEKIRREDFVLAPLKGESEKNQPLPIGRGQTISQPYTVALMLEWLQPEEGDSVLDVGSGSGWTAALLAEIIGEKGRVYALERIPELKEFGEKNAEKYGFVSSGRVKFSLGDGWAGLPKYAPFDKIHVAAGAEEIPKPLKDQLKIGGRLVMPVGPGFNHDIVLLEKMDDKEFKEKRHPGFAFVPLISNID
jgi:protein-L-isoaspartate(D-aspartate) O-methyltransferase